jgi:hypothetical protein
MNTFMNNRIYPTRPTWREYIPGLALIALAGFILFFPAVLAILVAAFLMSFGLLAITLVWQWRRVFRETNRETFPGRPRWAEVYWQRSPGQSYWYVTRPTRREYAWFF